VILLCSKIFWSSRRSVFFWLTLTIVTLYHVPLIMLIPWTDKAYPGIALLPFALPDFAIVYGAFKLAEKMARIGKQADPTVDPSPKQLAPSE